VLLKARCGKILGDLRKKREKYIIWLNEQVVDFQNLGIGWMSKLWISILYSLPSNI
jgi:hypothetical protein